MTQAEIKSLKKGDYIRQTASYGMGMVFEIITKNKTRVKLKCVSGTSPTHPLSWAATSSLTLSNLKYNIWTIDKEWYIRQQIKEWLEELK